MLVFSYRRSASTLATAVLLTPVIVCLSTGLAAVIPAQATSNATGTGEPGSIGKAEFGGTGITAAAIKNLSRNPPLYNDPRAPQALDPAGEQLVKQAIAAAGIPIFIALLPSLAGKPTTVVREIEKGVSRPGTYAVVVGESYEARSNTVDISGLMQRAFTAKRNYGTAAVLVEFTELVAATASGKTDKPADSNWVAALLAISIIVVIAGLYAWSQRQQPGPVAEPGSTDSNHPVDSNDTAS